MCKNRMSLTPSQLHLYVTFLKIVIENHRIAYIIKVHFTYVLIGVYNNIMLQH